MSQPHGRLGDSHNFGRRVAVRGDRVIKPRTIAWERLLLDGASPLRVLLDEAASRAGQHAAFRFLPDLAFSPLADGPGGEVQRLELVPLGSSTADETVELARIVGRSLALWSWLGVSDLHWENLALGRGEGGRIVFTPLDVESIFDDLALPTETKLLPDADPEVAAICRHACGVRRVLPFLGKPVPPGHLVAMAAEYRGTLDLLERHRDEVGAAIGQVENLEETPVRVCLRGTDVYVHAMHVAQAEVWPPFLDAETEQMARGDVPYFFRLPGREGIYYYADPGLQTVGQIPAKGDVPQLDPLLDPAGGLRSPRRRCLREEGLFTVLGAFDHPSFAGTYGDDELTVEFGDGVLTVDTAAELLETDRDLRDFVGSVYLPCRCGEVEGVFVPQITACEAGR